MTIEGIAVTRIGPNRASVTFQQSYRSYTYADQVTKTLELERKAGRWRIVRETGASPGAQS